MAWQFKKASNNLILAEDPRSGARVRFIRKNAKSPWESTGEGLTVESMEFLDFAPKSRAGRPKKFEYGKPFYIRVPAELHEKLLKCDGNFLRKALEEAVESFQILQEENKMKKTLDTSEFTEEQQQKFIEGWEAAGGYTDDMDSPAPWCCPWYYGNTTITVKGNNPKEWGADWWAQCKDEVEELLKESEE